MRTGYRSVLAAQGGGCVIAYDRTVNYIYSSWLARSGMQHSYGADIEHYGPDYDPASEQSVIRYAVPVGGYNSQPAGMIS